MQSRRRRRGRARRHWQEAISPRVPETGPSALARARVSAGVRTAAPRPARCNCLQAARPGAGHPVALHGVHPVAGGRLGGGALDRLFGEVHRDTFADGMAVFCNANGRGEDGRMEGENRGRGKPGWDGNKANSQAGSEKEGVRVIVGRRLPPRLPASRPRHPLFPPHRSPSPSREIATAAARVRAGPVCDSQAERIIRIMASLARSRRGSPGSQSSPSTQTIAGAPSARGGSQGEDTKQKKTNPGKGRAG